MKVVWHYNKSVNRQLFLLNQESKGINKDFLSLIRVENRNPIINSTCIEIKFVCIHSMKISIKVWRSIGEDTDCGDNEEVRIIPKGQ